MRLYTVSVRELESNWRETFYIPATSCKEAIEKACKRGDKELGAKHSTLVTGLSLVDENFGR